MDAIVVRQCVAISTLHRTTENSCRDHNNREQCECKHWRTASIIDSIALA